MRTQRAVSASVLLAVCSACSPAITDVDFCQVLTALDEYQGRTFRTEIVAIPDYHGRVATAAKCQGRAIGFAKSSFWGSPKLQELNDEMERAYLTRNGPVPWKAVAVRVTARVEKFPPPQPRYLLKLLDAGDDARLVDVPLEVGAPPAASSAERNPSL